MITQKPKPDYWDTLFRLNAGAELTITGNGTVIGHVGAANGCTAWLTDSTSKLKIENGDFYGETILYANNGTIVVNGGRFENDVRGDGHQQTLNVQGYLGFTEGKSIVMYGGTLVGDDPRFVNDGNMVPNGYAVHKIKNASGINEYTIIPETSVVATVVSAINDYDYNHRGHNADWRTKYGEDFPTRVTFGYTSLADAIENAVDGDTVTLKSNASGDGIVIQSDTFTDNGITIDLGNYKYTVDGKAVGSSNTKTQGFQFLKNNKITIKNGTLTTAEIVQCYNGTRGDYDEAATMIIQNYADLTLDSVTLDGTNLRDTGYTLSNNNSNIAINHSTITANGGYAFDVYASKYYDGVTVTVDADSNIDGYVEIGGDEGTTVTATLKIGEYSYNEYGEYYKVGGEFVKTTKRSINISADTNAVEMDDTVTISVTLKGNNIANAVYDLAYDTSKFKLITASTNTIANNGTIHEMLYKQDNTCYENGADIATYTFKALGQTENVEADFVISNTSASTYNESINAIKIATINNEKVSVKINLKEYVVAVSVDGNVVTDSTKCEPFTNADHTFSVTATPAATVSYKVNDGEETTSVSVSDIGTYIIEYTITPETGYAIVKKTFTLEIGDPVYFVEVNLGDGEDSDYVANKKIVLVYTDTDGLAFNYDNNLMIDVTERGYKYNGTEYSHVYAFVTDAIRKNNAEVTINDYKENISYVIPSPENLIKLTYSMDLNFDGNFDVQDITVAYGVYNTHEDYFNNIKYQKNILRADTDGNKRVTNDDANAVVNKVKGN